MNQEVEIINPNDPAVLDATAVVAVIRNEPGAEVILPYLPFALVSAVNLFESASVLMGKGYSFEDARRLISGLFLKVVPFNEEQAYLAAEFEPQQKKHNLSLADRCCLALAISVPTLVLTADYRWKGLTHPKLRIVFFR